MCCKNMTEDQKNRCLIASSYLLLFLAPFTFGVSAIIALILMSSRSDKISSSEYFQHTSYLSVSVFYFLAWIIVGSLLWCLLFPIALGIIIVASVWVLYRAIHGYSSMKIIKDPFCQ